MIRVLAQSELDYNYFIHWNISEFESNWKTLNEDFATIKADYDAVKMIVNEIVRYLFNIQKINTTLKYINFILFLPRNIYLLVLFLVKEFMISNKL